jgi:uncharacterized SAM-binding protein YcdF (DUF218 family)
MLDAPARPRLRALGVVLAVVLVALGGFTAWTYFTGTRHPQRADAIVVLSGDTKRIGTAVRLFDEHAARALAVSVWGHTPRGLCERSGVTCFRAHPFSTRGEAEATARLARTHGWRSIVVVSSRYHLRRAHMLFRRCTNARLQLVPSPTSLRSYVENVPLELAKFADELIVHRDC